MTNIIKTASNSASFYYYSAMKKTGWSPKHYYILKNDNNVILYCFIKIKIVLDTLYAKEISMLSVRE